MSSSQCRNWDGLGYYKSKENQKFLPMFPVSEFLLDLNMSNDPGRGNSGEAVEATRPQLKRPQMYRVIMLNDDYTPMEFVIEVLQRFFDKSEEQATQIMLTVHNKGSAVCAVHTRDIAETKAAIVNQYSRDCEHPLLCEIAPVDD
jgi:ATP-dependent Clp protease adaptor protein ClpS